jgi:UDP:flavonoid glycosyltransferase YjiC (YdhE family)
MKICFASIGATGHTYPYLKFVEMLVKRGHTVDWYATEDDSRPSMAPKVEAVGACYTDLPLVSAGDLTAWFRWYNHTFGFC